MAIRITKHCKGRRNAPLKPGDVVDYGYIVNRRLVRCGNAVFIPEDDPLTPPPHLETESEALPGLQRKPDDEPDKGGSTAEPFGLDDLNVDEARELMDGMGRGGLLAMKVEEAKGKRRVTLLRAIDEALESLE